MVGFLGLILLKSTKLCMLKKKKWHYTLYKDQIISRSNKNTESVERVYQSWLYMIKRATEKYSEEIGEDFLQF
jgi:hypothetical protein